MSHEASMPAIALKLKRLQVGGRLGISSWCWAADYYAGRFSLLDMPQLAAEKGFTLLEMNDFMLPPPRFSRVVRPLWQLIPQVPIDIWRYRFSSFRRLKAELDARHIRCICWTLNTDFTWRWRGGLGQQIYWRWGIAAARILEVERLRVILGGMPGEGKESLDSQVARRLARLVGLVNDQLPEVMVILENHWGLSTDIGRMMRIYELAVTQLTTSQRARFGVCLDPVNMPVEEMRSSWQLMAPHARHVHVKGEHSGGRIIDLDLFLDFLDQHSVNGYIVLEDNIL